MTRSKRRNENGKRRSTRRKTQRGAGKMMQSALSSLAKLRENCENLDNQIDDLLEENFTFSDKGKDFPTIETCEAIERIIDPEERFKKAQEVNNVHFKTNNGMMVMNQINIIQQLRVHSLAILKLARAKLKLSAALKFRKTLKKGSESALMSAADAKAYKEKMISAGDSWRAKFKTMTPAEQKAWSQKQKATRQDDFKRLEKNVGRGRKGGQRGGVSQAAITWKPLRTETVRAATAGKPCERYWNVAAGAYLCKGEGPGGKKHKDNKKVLQSYLSKLNQNLQLQAFILGLFESVTSTSGGGDADGGSPPTSSAGGVFGRGNKCRFPALKFTINQTNFKILIKLLLSGLDTDNFRRERGGAFKFDTAGDFLEFLKQRQKAQGPVNVSQYLSGPLFEGHIGGVFGGVGTFFGFQGGHCIKEAERATYIPSMRFYTNNEETQEDVANMFMDINDKAYNMIRIPNCLSTASKLFDRLVEIFNPPKGDTDLFVDFLWKECTGTDTTKTVDGLAITFISYIFKEWFNFSFASGWGTETKDASSWDEYTIALWNSTRNGGRTSGLNDDQIDDLNVEVDFALGLITHVIQIAKAAAEGTGEALGGQQPVEAANNLVKSLNAAIVCGLPWHCDKGNNAWTQLLTDYKKFKNQVCLINEDSLQNYAAAAKKVVELAGEGPARLDLWRCPNQKFIEKLDYLSDVSFSELARWWPAPTAASAGAGEAPTAASADDSETPGEGDACGQLKKDLDNAFNLWVYDLLIKSKTTDRIEVSNLLKDEHDKNSITYYTKIKAFLSGKNVMPDMTFPAPIYVVPEEAAEADVVLDMGEIYSHGLEPEEAAQAPAGMTLTLPSPPASAAKIGGGRQDTKEAAALTAADLGQYRGRLGPKFSKWLAFQTPYPASVWDDDDSGLDSVMFRNPWFEDDGNLAAWAGKTNVSEHMKNLVVNSESCFTQIPTKVNTITLPGEGRARGGDFTRDNPVLPLNAATCLIFEDSLGKGDADTIKPHPVQYRTKIWGGDGLTEYKETEGIIIVCGYKNAEKVSEVAEKDWAAAYDQETTRAKRISALWNVGKAAVGVGSLILSSYMGPGGGILSKLPGAAMSQNAILKMSSRQTKAEAAAKEKFAKSDGILSTIWNWGCAVITGGAAQIVRDAQDEEGFKAAHDAHIKLEKTKYEKQGQAERSLQQNVVGAAKASIEGAVRNWLSSGYDALVAEHKNQKDRDKYKERAASLEAKTKKFQQFYMYIIKINVGIIYQLTINIAILQLLGKVFGCVGPSVGGSNEVCRINGAQIGRINQLINFNQPIMGGHIPAAAKAFSALLAELIQKTGGTRDPDANTPKVLLTDGIRPFWRACQMAEQVKINRLTDQTSVQQANEMHLANQYFKAFLPGIKNWSPKAEAAMKAAAQGDKDAQFNLADFGKLTNENKNPLQICITKLHEFVNVKTHISYITVEDKFLQFATDALTKNIDAIKNELAGSGLTECVAGSKMATANNNTATNLLCDLSTCIDLWSKFKKLDVETAHKYTEAWGEGVEAARGRSMAAVSDAAAAAAAGAIGAGHMAVIADEQPVEKWSDALQRHKTNKLILKFGPTGISGEFSKGWDGGEAVTRYKKLAKFCVVKAYEKILLFHAHERVPENLKQWKFILEQQIKIIHQFLEDKDSQNWKIKLKGGQQNFLDQLQASIKSAMGRMKKRKADRKYFQKVDGLIENTFNLFRAMSVNDGVGNTTAADKIIVSLKKKIEGQVEDQQKLLAECKNSLKDWLGKCCTGFRSGTVAIAEDDEEERKTLQYAVNYGLMGEKLHEYQSLSDTWKTRLNAWAELDFDKILQLLGWQAWAAWKSEAQPIYWRRLTEIKAEMTIEPLPSTPRPPTDKNTWTLYEGLPGDGAAQDNPLAPGETLTSVLGNKIKQCEFWFWSEYLPNVSNAATLPTDSVPLRKDVLRGDAQSIRRGLIRNINNEAMDDGLFFKRTADAGAADPVKQLALCSPMGYALGGNNVGQPCLPYISMENYIHASQHNIKRADPYYIYKQTKYIEYSGAEFWKLSYYLSNGFMIWLEKEKVEAAAAGGSSSVTVHLTDIDKLSSKWYPNSSSELQGDDAEFCNLRNIFRRIWSAGYVMSSAGPANVQTKIKQRMSEQSSWWWKILVVLADPARRERRKRPRDVGGDDV